MSTNQDNKEMMSLKKELAYTQQIAVESLEQNGCTTPEIQKAISIFRINNGKNEY